MRYVLLPGLAAAGVEPRRNAKAAKSRRAEKKAFDLTESMRAGVLRGFFGRERLITRANGALLCESGRDR